MVTKLNLASSIFEGLNDKRGILICGYEWGFSKNDQRILAAENEHTNDCSAKITFSNKIPFYGERARVWPYDRRIIRWFELWGHPLSREECGGTFEKILVQTNWCNTEGHHIKGNIYQKLSQSKQIDNFLFHIRELEPSLILFMGSAMIDVLQSPKILKDFIEISGQQTKPLRKIQKEFPGRRFKIAFQSFEHCEVLSFPHPSGSRGLSDEYIALFKEEVGGLIAQVKNIRIPFD